MAKVFVSYSRKDIEFAKRLTAELQKSDLDFWIDWEGIPPTVDWWKEIEKGIEEADVFLFLISPDSAKSKICEQEIDTAVKNGKRIIPIVVREIKGDETPAQLSHLNWIFFRENDDFNTALQKLLTGIHTDYEWVKEHRWLQVRALDWERNSKDHGSLLRGKDLQEAEFQLATNTSKEPHPTDLQREYVFTSRSVADRQRRIAMGFSIAGIIALAVLAIWGWGQAVSAKISQATAEANEAAAQAASTLAFENAIRADQEAAAAQAASTLAVFNEEEAKKQAQIALARQWAADANAILASPNGNAETAALLSVRALQLQQDEYVPSADEALNKSLNRLYTKRIFNHHEVQVSAVAFSPNNDHILIGYIDGTAQLYDAKTGDELQSFSGFNGYYNADNDPTLIGVHAVAFSQQGDKLLIAGSDGYVQVWNLDSRTTQEIFAFSDSEASGQPDLLWSAEFSPDGEYILVGKGWPFVGPGKIEIWEIESGQQLFSFPQNQERFVSDAEFSRDGNAVLSTSYDGTAMLWDLDWNNHTATPRAEVEANSPIWDGSLSSDGTMLLLGLESSVAKLYRSDGSLIRNYVGHTGRITTVEFSPSGNFILTASLDNTARLWSMEGGNTVRIFADHANDISEATYAPDGLSVLTGSFDNTARIWNANIEHDSRIIYGHNDRISEVSFSPDGRFILSSSYDDTLHLWNSKTLDQAPLDMPESLIDPTFVFSAKGRWLVATGGTWTDHGGTSTVITWENSGEEYKLDRVIKQNLSMQVLAFSQPADGSESKYLYLGRGDPDRYLLQAGAWDTIVRTYNNWWWNNDVALTQVESDKAEYVAVAGIMMIPIYKIDNPDTSTSAVVCSIPWEGAYGAYGSQSIAFSKNGQYLASEYLNDIVIWDWQSGTAGNELQECTIVEQLSGHSGKVLDLTFSPDGNYLLSTSSDGTAILWDVKSWEKIRTLGGHEGDVVSAAFSPDNKFIVTGGADKTMRIWDTNFKDTVEQVCLFLNQLHRDFTDEERIKYGITDNNSTCEK